jgi:hypothetical protein
MKLLPFYRMKRRNANRRRSLDAGSVHLLKELGYTGSSALSQPEIDVLARVVLPQKRGTK